MHIGSHILLSPEAFMNLFSINCNTAPTNAMQQNLFGDAPMFSSESQMYEWIQGKLSGFGPLNREEFVCAPTTCDCEGSSVHHSACPPRALSLYHTNSQPITGSGHTPLKAPNDWSRIDLSIECSIDGIDYDPFDDEETHDNQHTATKRKKIFSRITSLVERVFLYQHRTWYYVILILAHHARIIRFDSTCIFVTTKFNYKISGAILTDFLCRFSHCDVNMRGHDPSAIRLEPGNPLIAKMRHFARSEGTAEKPEDYVQQIFEASLDDSWLWHKLEVHVRPEAGQLRSLDSSQPQGPKRFFVVGKPCFYAGGVVGRGTRGYIAVEVDDNGELVGSYVYLKDTWRVDRPGRSQEGFTLAALNLRGVPFVPTLVCHGDLPYPLTTSHTRLVPYEEECRIKHDRHYRIVVNEIGKPLCQFQHSGQLVKALYNVVQALEAAHQRCGIVHGDISTSNILLTKDRKGRWGGILMNWECAQNIHRTSEEGQTGRTGTWQFMSVHVQDNPRRIAVIADELESVFHVLVFNSVKFCHHTIPDSKIGQFLYDYFDDHSPHSHGERSGWTKRSALGQGVIRLSTYDERNSLVCTALRFIWPSVAPSTTQQPDFDHPLNRIIPTLLSWFKALYALDTLVDPAIEHSPVDHQASGVRIDLDEDSEDEVATSSESHDASHDLKTRILTDMAPHANYTATKQLASNLNTHTAMLKHLRAALVNEVWPMNERRLDNRP